MAAAGFPALSEALPGLLDLANRHQPVPQTVTKAATGWQGGAGQ